MKYSLKYRRATVYLNFNPRTGVCSCCNKKAKTQLHHWLYVFQTKDVKANPLLGLLNTTELCYYCHRIANSINHVLEESQRVTILEELRRSACNATNAKEHSRLKTAVC